MPLETNAVPIDFDVSLDIFLSCLQEGTTAIKPTKLARHLQPGDLVEAIFKRPDDQHAKRHVVEVIRITADGSVITVYTAAGSMLCDADESVVLGVDESHIDRTNAVEFPKKQPTSARGRTGRSIE